MKSILPHAKGCDQNQKTFHYKWWEKTDGSKNNKKEGGPRSGRVKMLNLNKNLENLGVK